MAEKIIIQINGEKREIGSGLSIEQVLGLLGLKKEHVAVELNRQIVRREEWSDRIICDQDSIEIVHFVGGGSC